MLTISRPDIRSDEIVELPISERYIKLPIKPYLEMVTYQGRNVYDELNKPQIALINAINMPKYRFICAALSRRLGKTFIVNVLGQLILLMPGTNILIMSPNFTLSSISFDLQRWLIKNASLTLVRDNQKDKILEIENGSTIRMGSIKTVDSCVGRSYDLIIFDEAALGQTDAENAFNISLRPTLDKLNSKAIFISTPRGKNNWFSQFYQRGFSDDPAFKDWASIHADYKENSRVSEEDIEQARLTMSDAEFQQEYMANFNIFEGKIYDFNDQWIEEYVPPENDKVEYIAGLDPGFKDPTAFCIISYNPNTEIFWVIEEFQKSSVTTEDHAIEIQTLLDKWNVDPIFIDSAAAQFAADLAYTYNIATVKGKKDVLPGIAYVQTLIGTGKLRVDPKCKHTIAMLDQYQWDLRETLTTERPLHNEYSHMADALRYALYTYIQ